MDHTQEYDDLLGWILLAIADIARWNHRALESYRVGGLGSGDTDLGRRGETQKGGKQEYVVGTLKARG